jgi:hypothetical protein
VEGVAGNTLEEQRLAGGHSGEAASRAHPTTHHPPPTTAGTWDGHLGWELVVPSLDGLHTWVLIIRVA